MDPVRHDRQADDVRRAEQRRRILRQQQRHAAPQFSLELPAAEPAQSPGAQIKTPPRAPDAPHAPAGDATARPQEAPGATQTSVPRSELRGEALAALHGPRTAHVTGDPTRDDLPAQDATQAADAYAADRAQNARRSAASRQVDRQSDPGTDGDEAAEAAEALDARHAEAQAARVAAVRRRRDGDADDAAAPQTGGAGGVPVEAAPDEQLTVQRLASPEVIHRVLLLAMLGRTRDGDDVMLLGLRIAGAGTLSVEIRRTGERRVRLRLRGGEAVRARVESELDALREALGDRRLTVEEIVFDATDA